MHKCRHFNSVLKRDDGQTINWVRLSPVPYFIFHVVCMLAPFELVRTAKSALQASFAHIYKQDNTNKKKNCIDLYYYEKRQDFKRKCKLLNEHKFSVYFFCFYSFCAPLLSFFHSSCEAKGNRRKTSVGIIKPLRKAQHCKLLSMRWIK